MISKPQTIKGFTLLEVIIALAIIAITLPVAISTSGDTAASAGYLQRKTLAHWVAMNKFTELQIEKKPLSKGTKSGTSEMANADWEWQTKISETPDDNVMRVDIEVFLADNDSEQALTKLSGFLLNPEITTPQNNSR